MKAVVVVVSLVLLVGWPPVGELSCPDGMVPVRDAFCIDRYEWPNREGVRPSVGLSGIVEDIDLRAGRVLDAERLCASVGKRVCTAREWAEACRGPDRLRYSWGNDLHRYAHDRGEGICNYDRSYRAPDELRVALRDPAEMARLDQSEPAGSRPGCVSGYGAYDMSGNAREWVRCPGVGRYGWCQSFAFWATPAACETFTTIHAPKWHLYDASTRCCL